MKAQDSCSPLALQLSELAGSSSLASEQVWSFPVAAFLQQFPQVPISTDQMPGLQTPPELGAHYQLALLPSSSVPLLPGWLLGSFSPWVMGFTWTPFSGCCLTKSAALTHALASVVVTATHSPFTTTQVPLARLSLPVFSTLVCYTASASLILHCHHQQIMSPLGVLQWGVS